MGTPKRRLRLIAGMIVWLGLAHGAVAGAPAAQRTYASAEDAVTAFVAALRSHNVADIRAILGPESDRLLDTGDPLANQRRDRFVASYDEKHTLVLQAPGRMELDVGQNDWPLPFPIVQAEGHWQFDTKAGAQAIIDRRIGRNELSAIRTLLACVDAEHDYSDRVKQATGTGVYAEHLVSTPGQKNGLYWPAAAGEAASPLGPLVDAAEEAGYPADMVSGKPIPYEGYYFRILKAQGPDADGGAKSYVQSGRMTGGFALIAWPAVFDSTGIVTFIVGPDGEVYQKDLGPDTAHLAAAITAFDPDVTWAHVEVTSQ